MPNRQIDVWFLLVAMCLCALNAVRAAETEPPAAGAEAAPREEPDASELVRHVRSKARIEEIRSLYLRIKGKHTTTKAGIELRQTELEKQYGGDVPPERLAELRMEQTDELELAFDEHRLR